MLSHLGSEERRITSISFPFSEAGVKECYGALVPITHNQIERCTSRIL